MTDECYEDDSDKERDPLPPEKHGLDPKYYPDSYYTETWSTPSDVRILCNKSDKLEVVRSRLHKLLCELVPEDTYHGSHFIIFINDLLKVIEE